MGTRYCGEIDFLLGFHREVDRLCTETEVISLCDIFFQHHNDFKNIIISTSWCLFKLTNQNWWTNPINQSVNSNGLCIKPGIQERGTECGERGEWGECYIPGNAAKQTFRGMSSNIPENVAKQKNFFFEADIFTKHQHPWCIQNPFKYLRWVFFCVIS